MRSLLTRSWGRRFAGAAATDLVLATVLTVVALASAIGRKPPEGPLPLTVPVAMVMTVTLAWRTRAPLIVVTTIMITSEVQTWVTVSPGSLWALAVFLICAFTVAVACTEGRAAVGGTIVVGGLWLQEWHDDGTDYLFVVIVFGGAWLLGRAARTWRRRAETAEAEQDDKTRLAVAEERLRIARELHDMVAHGLGVIAVQANAAEAALDHDPRLAQAPLAAVKDSARNALDDMRQLLGVLRNVDDDSPPHEPQPGLARLDTLLAGFRRAGLPVDSRIDGPTAGLPPAIDLAVYRIVQEGLTNALKHAGPVPAQLLITSADGRVSVEVTNAAGTAVRTGGGTGHGLAGIRERTAAAGGHLTAGPTGDGGFHLRAVLPSAGVAPDGVPASGLTP